jgi:transposase-like protein
MGDSEVTPRVQPFYCPYCGEEDFVPSGTAPGQYHCRDCDRSFVVKFIGLGGEGPEGEPSGV